MTTQRIALVTGANQGLGLALVEGLAAQMTPRDTVLLTGRDPDAVRTAAAEIAAGPAVARVEGRVLDVRDGDAIAALAAELGEVDIVFSNAAARMSPDADPADEVDAVAETNNLATTRILRAFAPRLRPGGRLVVVASSLGTLDKLDDRVAHRFAESCEQPRRRRRARRRLAPGRPRRPRRTGRLRHLAQHPVQGRPGRGGTGRRTGASCSRSRRGQAGHGALPGADRHRRFAPVVRGDEQGPSPAEAARWPVELALAGEFDAGFYGELVQFAQIVPWESGVPVPRTLTGSI